MVRMVPAVPGVPGVPGVSGDPSDPGDRWWCVAQKEGKRLTVLFFCLFVEQGEALEASGIRVEVDNRINKTAGWKMTHWEQKGVPLRLEIGSNEMASESLVACRRHNNAKVTIAMSDVVAECHQLLADIHDSMLDTARQDRDAQRDRVFRQVGEEL